MQKLRPSAEAGMILPAVLFLLALLAALTLQMQISSRARLASESRADRRTMLRAAAADAAWHALRNLAADTETALTHTNSDWAIPLQVELPDGVLTSTRVRDAARCFNINNLGVAAVTAASARLPHMIAADLLAEAGCEEPENTAMRLLSAFNGRPAGSTGALIRSFAELAEFAPDADPERLAGLFSVLPNTGLTPTPVNVNTAPPAVLRAVLGPAREFESAALIRQRDIQPLAALEHFSEFPAVRDFAAYLDVRSMFFELDALAEKDQARAHIWTLVERNPLADLRVRRWVCR